MDQYNFRTEFYTEESNQHLCRNIDGKGSQAGANAMEEQHPSLLQSRRPKSYDYTLKFLLVGDSDVGKEEILSGLNEEGDNAETLMDAVFASSSPAVNYKSTVILLDGKRIRLQLW